ncbi:hypothetical protein VTK73DRAFT_596 [Phialemonium thermophilum]|uniref:Uncharacterized protein n=1 Tax=Phialemonium thermophilum TaxID=223376 RepID=A0ABR3VUP6_9PEZI
MSLIKKLGLGVSSSMDSDHGSSLPLYSRIVASESEPALDAYCRGEADTNELDEIENGQLHTYPPRPRRHHGQSAPTASSSTTAVSTAAGPSAAERLAGLFRTRFLADFTLGFADGLTVPFALTAGLSSLGHTDTVIYAGMAEICAGSISMGIGGYLSARGEKKVADAKAAAAAAAASAKATSSSMSMVADDVRGSRPLGAVGPEKEGVSILTSSGKAAVARYLRPLELPPQLLDMVLDHLQSRPEIEESLAFRTGAEDDEDDDEEEETPTSPIFVGVSVSLGYLLGGLLPLFPYFFVSQVGSGLFWSFVVCIVVLFLFGFSKDFFVESRSRDHEGLREMKEPVPGLMAPSGRWNRTRIPWGDIGRSAWEGLQMVILGSVAALAAVVCVRLFEGMRAQTPASQ